MLWYDWWNLVCELRSACARSRTFLWMSLCLAGFSTRKDLLGVTSIVRALGLEPACYDRLLDFFHSPALDLDKLTHAWCALVFRFDPGLLRVNLKPVLVGDGIKVAKAGRKMPGVKKLHQESDSNTKPEYIFGHSCQAVAVLTQALSSVAPSEHVVAIALRNTLPEFLATAAKTSILVKFIRERLDLSRIEGTSLAA